jgi:hypothetical protein
VCDIIRNFKSEDAVRAKPRPLTVERHKEPSVDSGWVSERGERVCVRGLVCDIIRNFKSEDAVRAKPRPLTVERHKEPSVDSGWVSERGERVCE